MKTGFGLAMVLLLATCGSAAAAQFQVTSGDMRDEGSLAQVHWFSGFGCTGGNVSPQLAWKNAPVGDPQLCRHRLRSGCTYRQRLVALDGGEYQQQRDELSRWCRR
ncbi:putative kinase inhibitor [Raoultella terrigena]|uniref:Putative kinase inhibitor n=1 Tax=Raoultella terrigena TaxID=577 RepID=A0A4U9D9K4_RAOTE|nr:putative kinase inhibitor [Raoultella terrigena]